MKFNFIMLGAIVLSVLVSGCGKQKPIYRETIELTYSINITICGRFHDSTCTALVIGPNSYGSYDHPCYLSADKRVSGKKFGTVSNAVFIVYKDGSSETIIPDTELTNIYEKLCIEMAKHGDLTKYIEDHEL